VRLLVIGGARFSGRALTELALERGHEVTLFHRNPTELLPDAEHVLGDREQGVGALVGRRFDAVVDTCGYLPGLPMPKLMSTYGFDGRVTASETSLIVASVL
jgi:2'-hydroxyisoflavone reductase